jgi:hypothetical protein
MADPAARDTLLDTINELRRELLILRSRVDVVESWLDLMERQTNIAMNKEYTNQDGPGFDPSQPAPERHEP